jgi:GGDEF domain-containing protein
MTADKLLVKMRDLLRSCFAPTDIFANSGCSRPGIILSLQIFQFNPRIDRLQQQIRQQITNNQHRRTHHQSRHD